MLGKLDGFCETISAADATATNPCPPQRGAFGGLIGFAEEVQRAKSNGAYLLLTGNNLPKNFNANDPYAGEYMARFRSLPADVIALGQDDLLRAVFPAKLNQTTLPWRFTAAVKDFLRGGELKFLASNAAVRLNRTGLNQTWFKGYELMISADQSIPWTMAKLSFAVPNHRYDTMQATLSASGQPTVSTGCVDVRSGSGSVPVSLHPGTRYTLKISDPSIEASFEFQVDAALTPWDSNPEDLQGLPAAWVWHAGAAPVLAVSLIDPAVLDVLDSSNWKDKDTDGASSLVLYPPMDAVKALLSRRRPGGALPVLLSDLNDGLAAQAASASAAWSVVSFGADSHLLGCGDGGNGCAKGRSGDYRSGAYSILDGSRIWTRPEWVGETLIDVTITPGAGDGSRFRVEARDVPGDRFMPYRNTTKFQPGVWWRTRDDMAMVLMDAMRQSQKTDLAVADERAIDPEAIAEMSAMADAGMLSRIGPEELMEILWRHDPYTVIKLTGNGLVTALGKLAKIPADEDSGSICVRGLGGPQFQQPCSLPDTVKANVLEINGRYLNPDEYYAVALPQSLARAAGLAYPRHSMVNVFNTVLAYLNTVTIPPSPPNTNACTEQTRSAPGSRRTVQNGAAAPLSLPFANPEPGPAAGATQPARSSPIRWPNPLEKKLRSLIILPPASIELGGQNYSVPDRNGKPDASGFAAIPLVQEKAQHTAKLNMVGELHVVPIDMQPISLDLFSRVNLNRLETYNTSTGFPQFAYTPDLWTNGAVLRSKIATDAVTRAAAAMARRMIPVNKRPSVRLQPFLGYFDDTSVYHFTATYVRASDSAAFPENDKKPNYAYFGTGLELSPIGIGKYFSVNNTRLEQDFGMNYAAPKAVFIGGKKYDMDAIRRCGVQNLLDGGVSGCDQAPLDGPLEVRYQYATQRQSRRQFLTSLVLAVGPEGRKETLTLDIKANQWGKGPDGYVSLDPVRTAEFLLKTSFPIGAGITFGPYLRYLTVNAYGSDGNFISRRYGFTLNIPLTGSRGHGRFFF
jgi:hypothetical protein